MPMITPQMAAQTPPNATPRTKRPIATGLAMAAIVFAERPKTGIMWMMKSAQE